MAKSNFRPGAKKSSSPSGGYKATDFDAVLLEGFQALARRVQEHHEYLQAHGSQAGRGQDDEMTALPGSVMHSSQGESPTRVRELDGKLPVLDEDEEVKPMDSGEKNPFPSRGVSGLPGPSLRARSEPVPPSKVDEVGYPKRTYDLLKRWKTMEGLKAQDPSAAVATALYQQDETESIEGSDAEGAESDIGGNPGPAQRCVNRVNNCMTPWMLSPNAVVRSCWDSLACVFVIYECIMIPLAFFDIGESAFLDVVGWIVRLFWSIDFPLSCFTGYNLPGERIEMRPKKVLPHYAKTWMSLDVSMLCVDWAEVAIGGVGSLNAARMGKTVKSLRMIRMMRLWRLLNVNRLPDSVKVLIHHYFQSEVSRIVLDICKILLFLVWINHVLACCWYGIADSVTPADNSWLRAPQFEDQEWSYLYVTCFHWSLTQFASSTDVFPANVYERTFAVCSLVFCFIFSASIVSSITTSMTRLSIARSKETTKLAALKEYLREHHISSRTALRVQRNAQYALEEQKRHTPEEDIELLGFLSEPLRVELRYEITMPALRKHGFFQVVDQEGPAFARQLCYKALSSSMISKADILFVQGADQAHEMFFFTDGKLSYYKDSQVGLAKKASSQRMNIVRKKDKISVGLGDWACEGALWTVWVHCGTMRAKSQCTVLKLSAEEFHKITSQFKDAVPAFKEYGRRFLAYLNGKPPEETTDLVDVEWDCSEVAKECFATAADQENAARTGSAALKRGATASMNNFFRPEERPTWLNSFLQRAGGGAQRPTKTRSSVSAPTNPPHPVLPARSDLKVESEDR